MRRCRVLEGKINIFADHSATTDIARQTALSSSSSDRMNLRMYKRSRRSRDPKDLYALTYKRLAICIRSSYACGKRVRASQYASQFDLDVRWRLGKQDVAPDALSRLLRKREEKFEADAPGVLDEVFAYNLTLTEMSQEYREKLAAAYKGDYKWKRMLESLEAESLIGWLVSQSTGERASR